MISRGGLPRLTAEWLRVASGASITSAYYPATPQVLDDVLAGRVEAIVESLPALTAAVTSGSLKVLAIDSPSRLSDFPDVPTVAETISSFQSTGLVRPDGATWHARADRAQVSDDLRAALTRPDLLSHYRYLGTMRGR